MSQVKGYWDQFFADDFSSDDDLPTFTLQKPDSKFVRNHVRESSKPEKKNSPNPSMRRDDRNSQIATKGETIVSTQSRVTPTRDIQESSLGEKPVHSHSGKAGEGSSSAALFYKEVWPEETSQGETRQHADPDLDNTIEVDDISEPIITSTPKSDEVKRYVARPEFSFEGHDPAVDGIGVFYGE